MLSFLSPRKVESSRVDRGRRRAHRPAIEPLEGRALLSGAGSLDSTFGSGGIVTTALGSGNSTAYAVTVQPSDGKIVAAGDSSGGFTAARYTTAGALDSTFGSGGSVAISFFQNEFEHLGGAAIDGSGRIVLAGVANNSRQGKAYIALARLNSNGSLDSSFGSKGKVTTLITQGAEIDALVIQPDGKPLVAGWTFGGSALLARYNANGGLDSSFGSGGIVTTTLGFGQTNYHSLALQSDGKILAGGVESPSATGNPYIFTVARYSASGTLDATFDSGGVVTTTIGGNPDWQPVYGVLGLLVQSNGMIVAAGTVPSNTGGSSEEVALARYDATGHLDPSFGTGGVVVTPTPASVFDYTAAAALQSDGSIVVAGDHQDATGTDFEVERYTSAGALDTTFGGTGIVTTAIGSGAAAHALLIQPSDGKIVMAGSGVSESQFALARYLGSATPSTATALASMAGVESASTTPTPRPATSLGVIPGPGLVDIVPSGGLTGSDGLPPFGRRRPMKAGVMRA
jgi:uncharacterized delta-60 repeat protein